MYMKILVTYKIFLVLRSIQTLGWEENDAYTKVTVIYFVGGFMAYAVNEIVILNSVGIFERLVNNLVGVGYQFFREVPSAKVRKLKNFLWLMRLWTFVCVFIGITSLRKVFKNPALPPLMTSLFPHPAGLPFKTKLLIACYHFCILGCHFYMLILNGITVVLFAFISINITMGVRYNPRTGHSQAKEHNLFFKYHRFLSVLQQHFNAVFGKWTLGNIVATSGGICVNTFLCVSHLHSPLRSFIVAAMGCFVLLNMYNSLGQLYEQSKETLFSWRIGTRFKSTNIVQDAENLVKILKTYGRIINLGSYFGIVPYKWENSKLIFLNSKPRLWIYWGYLSLIFSYELFLIPRSIHTLVMKDVNLFTKITLLYFVFGYLSYNVNEMLIVSNYGAHEMIVNNMVGLAGKFYKENPGGVCGKGNIKQFMWLIRLWFFVGLFIPVTNVLSVFRNPELPALLTSFFPEPGLVPLKWKLLIAAYHLCILGVHLYMVIFNGVTVILFVFVFVNIIKDMRINNLQIDHWMTFQIKRYYSVLSVLQNYTNAVFGIWTIQTAITTVVGVIINAFLAIIFFKSRSYVIATIGCIVILMLFKNLGQLFEESRETFLSWKKITQPEFRKFHRSCRPLRVSVGSFYFADKSLMLTLLTIIVTHSANLILTFTYD
ncbi:unnamed protein product [Allacma fusca]|uniref:Uncharacterized protein n=1 Tax=Allacma fusca TaxID=39272 RepID=A0A8J2NR42_9HEXA|nr:unnamed protein product [Allacma fusca]